MFVWEYEQLARSHSLLLASITVAAIKRAAHAHRAAHGHRATHAHRAAHAHIAVHAPRVAHAHWSGARAQSDTCAQQEDAAGVRRCKSSDLRLVHFRSTFRCH